ncbi:MAG: histidine kinase dimerization/phospho-acceptor domain-containing protein [Armatimonadota bacterium]
MNSEDGAIEPLAIFAAETLAHVRHELRTPVNQIIGYAELVAEEASDRGHGEYADDLGKIVQAARTLDTLIGSHLGSHRLQGTLDHEAPVRPRSVEADPGGDAPRSSGKLGERC